MQDPPSDGPRTYRTARQIGRYTRSRDLKLNRLILLTAIRRACKETGRTLADFYAVIPALESWLSGETPLGAKQRFDCAALCTTLGVPLHDAFPDLLIDYHA